MLRRTLELGGATYQVRLPATAGDLLWWTAYACSQPDPAVFAELSAQWALEHIETVTIGTSGDDEGAAAASHPVAAHLVQMLKTEGGVQALVDLCRMIAAAAMFPASTVEDLRTLWDRQCEVRDDARKPACLCARCEEERRRRDEEIETDVDLPSDAKCLFRGLSASAIAVAAAIGGIDDSAAALQAPPWALQILALRKDVTAAVTTSAEKDREARRRTEELNDQYFPGWRERAAKARQRN